MFLFIVVIHPLTKVRGVLTTPVKDEEGNFVFERTSSFDRAWKDLHYLRSLYANKN